MHICKLSNLTFFSFFFILLTCWIWCFWNCISIILHFTPSRVQITYCDFYWLSLFMSGDAYGYEHCKNNCRNSLGAGVALKSFRVANMPNRFKTGWTAGIPRRQIHLLSPIQNVSFTFPTGKKDTETILGKERKTKQNNIPKNIIC